LVRNVVLCKEGIYGVVRHPYYLGNYLIDWSFCVLSGNPFMVIMYPLLFFRAYGPTMLNEEKLLLAKHGSLFLDFNIKTPRVLPNLKSLKQTGDLFKGFSLSRVTHKECSRIMKFSATGLFLTFLQKIRADNVTGAYQTLVSTSRNFDQFLLLFL
jgi:hypothetical protein